MSADNYGIIARHGDKWGVWMAFSSDEIGDEKVIASKDPMESFDTHAAAMEHCHGEYFEYGYHTISDELINIYDTYDAMRGQLVNLGDSLKEILFYIKQRPDIYNDTVSADYSRVTKQAEQALEAMPQFEEPSG